MRDADAALRRSIDAWRAKNRSRSRDDGHLGGKNPGQIESREGDRRRREERAEMERVLEGCFTGATRKLKVSLLAKASERKRVVGA